MQNNKKSLNIGIYKPYKPILFNDNEDTASWSREITNWVSILEKRQHNLYLMTKTDYRDTSEKIKVYEGESLDCIFMFNGVWDKHEETEKEFFHKYRGVPVYLMCTDLALTSENHDIDRYKRIFTQSPITGTYAKLETLWLADKKKPDEFLDPDIITQKHGTLFFGTERGRLKDIIEYVFRPDVDWVGKSDFFGFKNFVDRKELDEKLNNTKYSIVIADDSYYRAGFITQRLFELMHNDIIAFVDDQYDKSFEYIPENHFLRVHNYQEFYEKRKTLSKHPYKYFQLLKFQRSLLDSRYYTGSDVYNRILKVMKSDGLFRAQKSSQ